ncbi:hypothetical protein ES703_35269 [subsurface metagenome]
MSRDDLVDSRDKMDSLFLRSSFLIFLDLLKLIIQRNERQFFKSFEAWLHGSMSDEDLVDVLMQIRGRHGP